MKKVSRLLASFVMLAVLVTFAALTPAVAETENAVLSGSAYRERDGSHYWISSNLREWMNSDAENVAYTGTAPTPARLGSNAYADERGFLTNFTPQEMEGIAVTKRRATLSSVDGTDTLDDGSLVRSQTHGRTVPWVSEYHEIMNYYFNDIEDRWHEYWFRYSNDKVFNLSPIEMYHYGQTKGMDLKKSPTNALRQEANLTEDYYNYYTSYPIDGSSADFMYVIDKEGKPAIPRVNRTSGVAPAMHLKPEYTLPDGRVASSLVPGDTVTFGNYNGEPIVWDVVNKTNANAPLLWSQRIITSKPYDTPGDAATLKSDHIDFPVHDVDLSGADLQVYSTAETELPNIKLDNEDVASIAQHGSFELQVSATDNVGMSHILMPDGSRVNLSNGQNTRYLVEENGVYLFTAVDVSGNHSYLSVPVGNITPPANVVISSSAEGWTNKDVSVDIFASNDIEPWTSATQTQRGYAWIGPTFPEHSSYAGKRFRITGKVKTTGNSIPLGNNTVEMLMQMNVRRPIENTNGWHYSYQIFSHPEGSALLSETVDGYYEFDFIYTVDGRYYSQIRPRLGLGTNANNTSFNVEWKDLKYELLDIDDFAIDYIELPSGERVNTDRYTDTITKDDINAEGEYTYTVRDNRGMDTVRTINLQIDQMNPVISLTPSTTETTHSNVIISAKATDTQSGIRSITLPNDQVVQGSTANYNVTVNGDYTFIVEDIAGNKAAKTIKVGNIDKGVNITKPIINNFPAVTLTDTKQTVSIDVGTIKVKDWTEGNNYWRVDVSSTQMKNTDDHTLPVGSLQLKPFSWIDKIEGSGMEPTTMVWDKQVIDSGSPVGLAVSNGSRGEYALRFPEGALKLSVDPAAAKTGSYSTTVEWQLVRAP